MLIKSTLKLRNDPVAFEMGWFFPFISEDVLGDAPDWCHLCWFTGEGGELLG